VVYSKRGDLVRQKKGRLSAGGGEPCPATGKRSRKFKIPKQGFSFFFQRGRAAERSNRFRFRVFFLLPPYKCVKLPLLCMCWKLLFIDKNIARSPNLVLQLLSFFINFILFFWIFLININSNEENH
jgi:hypothetical protein